MNIVFTTLGSAAVILLTVVAIKPEWLGPIFREASIRVQAAKESIQSSMDESSVKPIGVGSREPSVIQGAGEIQFSAGSFFWIRLSLLDSGHAHAYRIWLLQGQQLRVTSDADRIVISSETGRITGVSRDGEKTAVVNSLPYTGFYEIEVANFNDVAASYQLTVSAN